MPTKIAKDEGKNKKNTSTKKATNKVKKETNTRKADSISKKTSAIKKTTSKPKKAATTKKSTVAQKESTTKSKTTTKKTSSNKQKNTKAKVVSKKIVNPNIVEYYDLPSRYNKTMVNILFQTPKKLFVYWEISEDDIVKLQAENGIDFFYNSTPYLIVKNLSKNYSFEIQINDFANCWYFDVPDSNCNYSVELIRKHNNSHIPVQIQTSNNLEVPNNHILFEKNRKEVFFINVKTNNVVSKNIANLQFINHIGIAKPITISDFYNKFYDEKDLYRVNNPSSY